MFIEKHLSNGIRVIARPMDSVRSLSIGVWVKAGSNYEEGFPVGISHFIEHMLFKGTSKRSAKDIAEEIDNVGGSINAFTSKDCTAYYAKVLHEDAPLALDILSDMLMNSVFDPLEIKKEISVVKEEIAMYDDSPEDVVYDLFAELSYPDHPLGLPILGYPESVDAITRQDILSYMEQYYVSGNTTIALAGYITDDIYDQFEQAFKAYPQGHYTLDLPDATFKGGYKFAHKDIEQNHLCIGFDGIKFSSEDFYAMLLLSNYFGGTSSSRLFQTIREDHGLTYSIYSHPTYFKHAGNLSIYMSYQPQHEGKIIPLIIREMKDLKAGLTDDTIRALKNQLKGSYLLGLEGSSAIMNILGKRAVYDAPLETMDQIISRINAISLGQVHGLIDDLFKSPIAMTMAGKIDEDHVAKIYKSLLTEMGVTHQDH